MKIEFPDTVVPEATDGVNILGFHLMAGVNLLSQMKWISWSVRFMLCCLEYSKSGVPPSDALAGVSHVEQTVARPLSRGYGCSSRGGDLLSRGFKCLRSSFGVFE